MHECTRCEKYGLRFRCGYKPVEFIEGKKNSLVWIVELNPAFDEGWVDYREPRDLESYFDDLDTIHRYFKDFGSVSRTVFENFGKEHGTAHTDIVKCSSKSFPPESVKGKRAKEEIIANCSEYFMEQIVNHKPKIIVCNGAPVSQFMISFLPPPDSFTKERTSYWSDVGGVDVCVILSGFIGRIDNYARRRLGIEIEERLNEVHLRKT